MKTLYSYLLAAIMLYVVGGLWLVVSRSAAAFIAFLIAGSLTLAVGYFSARYEETHE